MWPGGSYLGSVAWADLGKGPLAALQNQLTRFTKGTPGELWREAHYWGERSTGIESGCLEHDIRAAKAPPPTTVCSCTNICTHNWGLQKNPPLLKKVCEVKSSDWTIREGWQPQGPSPFILDLPCSIHVCTAKPQLTDEEILREGSILIALQGCWFEWEWDTESGFNLCY